ncbi:hypothetical protein D3870_03660 [Noviherbaspirillum cavernae]|uniref:Transferrin-binding protein B C-lobe/N-lobe beta barrel domain-containing protein n=2 Tax=Noviherbaspirillum cavernae TaxID=2320862 RepID=A0A418WYQ6_9BURK|nr:hypothetical protein D3870_03660 [Noviherbaspirillum cavernae]
MTMSCVDGAGYQCSGGTLLRSDNGIALTRSGVQVYGKSTSDLIEPIADRTNAKGLTLASGGWAEVRLARQGNGSVSGFAMLLNKLGLSWDGTNERPVIIETFNLAQGRVTADGNGLLSFATLPDSANLGFYDVAVKGTAGTQANYANNHYFPRAGNPSRCPPNMLPCPAVETRGMQSQAGDWRSGGTTPDSAQGGRLHEDGDVHAGDGMPDQNGNRTILPGGSGIGVPYPGSKGYRGYDNWSFAYANLGTWMTQDTVQIVEWTPGSQEHNKNRRGIVAFGEVTDPVAVPASGSASYAGVAYGWHARNATEDAVMFRAVVTVTADFARREVTVTLSNATTHDAARTPVPVALKSTVGMGTAGRSVANYLNGAINAGTLTGGLGGRYFGPVVATGSSGNGPQEIGGAFSLSNASTAQVVVGGFIARKQ